MSSASLLLLSNALFFAFSMLGVLASVAIFFLARATEGRADRDLEAYKAQASAEMSQARVEVEQAKAHAASELADAALSNQKSAALELQIQKEKSVAKGKVNASDSHAGKSHKRNMSRTIYRPVNIPLSVGMADSEISIVSEEGDAESQDLANAIRALFDGGSLISVDHVARGASKSLVGTPGVHIFRSHDVEAMRISKALLDVLSKNRIECDIVDGDGKQGLHATPGRPGAASIVAVYVGRHPE